MALELLEKVAPNYLQETMRQRVMVALLTAAVQPAPGMALEHLAVASKMVVMARRAVYLQQVPVGNLTSPPDLQRTALAVPVQAGQLVRHIAYSVQR